MTKQQARYIHIAIMLTLIIGFHFLPPIGTITPVGMKILGIFLAMLYGWTICGMIWPSMLGMIAVPIDRIIDYERICSVDFRQ